MEDVKRWLNDRGKDYDKGVALFLKYSRDKTLIALFTREDETAFKRSRLEQALKDLFNDTKLTSGNDNATSISRKPATDHKQWPEPITDTVLKALYEQFKPLYAELMNLQARVYDVALLGQNGDSLKKMEACQMAHRIMDIDDILDDIYGQRDHYLKYGRLPGDEPKQEIVGDPVRWATNLKNAERYVRDYKLKLSKKPQSPLAPRWEQKLKEHQQAVERYRKLLKLDE